MNEVFIIQPNPDLLAMSQAFCNLDVTSRIKFTNKSVSAPITGKKIVSSIQVPESLQEKSPPNRLFSKKSITKDHSPPNSKSKPVPKASPPHPKKPENSHPSCNSKKKKRKVIINIPKPAKSHAKVTEYKENEEISPNPFTLTTKLKKIIKSSLKKEKVKKTLEEIKKKKQIIKKEEKKSDLNTQNHHIRQMNKRCRKVKLHHKYSWGVDQSRFRDTRDVSSEKDNSRKARSTEKVRTGLDKIKEIQLELGKSFIHIREPSQVSDVNEIPKQRHVSDPEVLRFMRKQHIQKREKEQFSNMTLFAEASKKKNALNKLVQIAKNVKPKLQSKRKKKSSRAKRSQDQIKDSEEIKEQDFHNLTLVYETIMQHEKSEDSKIWELSKDSSKHTLGEQRLKEQQKVDIRTLSAIKIQRAVREFLEKCRVYNLDEFSYTDELVKEILNHKKNGTESVKSSVFSIPEYMSPVDLEFNKTSELIDLNSNHPDLIQFTDSVELIDKSLVNDKLKEQILVKQAQIRTLEQIKEKEMQDLKTITNKVGVDKELKDRLNEVLEKRYNQLMFLLEGNLNELEESYFNRLGTEERENFLIELEEKQEEFEKIVDLDGRVIESPVESIIGNNKVLEIEENRIAIYKPKNVDSVISYDLSEIAAVNDTRQLSNILSAGGLDSAILSQIPDDQNMFVEDYLISSDSSSSPEMPKLEMFSPTIDPAIEEISLDFSNSMVPFDSSLSGNFKFEVSENSYTPEYLPDRPSAPLHYFDRESPDTNPSPVLINDSLSIGNISRIQVELTPDLVVLLAEDLILQIISEQLLYAKTPKIDTTPESVTLYCKKIFESYSLAQLSKDLSEPIQIKKTELLQKVQSDIIQYGEIDEILYPGHLINVNIYIDIEKKTDSCRAENKSKDSDLTLEAEHIHNKAIFDANNEALNILRTNNKIVPFGITERFQIRKPAEKVAEEAVKIVKQWCSNQIRDLHYEEIVENISEEEVLTQLNEERLIRMIFSDIAENEVKWAEYGLEEIQVKLELADSLVFALSEEVIFILDN